jgi:predicted amidohydrolase
MRINRRDFVKLAATSAVATTVVAPGSAGAQGLRPARDQVAPATAPPIPGRLIKVLGVPFKSQEGQIQANVETAIQIIREELAKDPVDLVVLPELFTCGYCGYDLSPFAESADGPTAEKFATLSRELDVLIGFGFAESSGQKKVYNSWLLLEPGGKRHLYRKTHLHPTPAGGKTNEPEFLLPGDTLEPFNTRLGRIGVMICYDGCLVEVPRVLALKGADLILWPSRSGGYLAGQSLPQVRSLDNAIATVLLEGGQVGDHLAMDAWSVVYTENGSRRYSERGDKVFRVAIDTDAGRRLRASTDAGAHSLYEPRRPELYSVIAKSHNNLPGRVN